MHPHRMPRVLTGKPRGRPRKSLRPPVPAEVCEFGFDPNVPPQVDVAPLDPPEAVAPEILAIGKPPDDAAGIQKWNYQILSTMAYLASVDPTVSAATRMKRTATLAAAAARHYPDAAKYDLAQKIDRDAKHMSERKRAKAAAKLERRPAIGGAKVIPIRRDG